MAQKKETPEQEDHSIKLFSWVKSLESKLNNLSREFDLVKNESLQRSQKFRKDVKHVTEKMLEVQHTQEKLQQTMDLLIKEMKKTAGLEEVQVLKKYMEFWNPTNFVTTKDLDRHWERKMDEEAEKKKHLIKKNSD